MSGKNCENCRKSINLGDGQYLPCEQKTCEFIPYISDKISVIKEEKLKNHHKKRRTRIEKKVRNSLKEYIQSKPGFFIKVYDGGKTFNDIIDIVMEATTQELFDTFQSGVGFGRTVGKNKKEK